MDVSVDYLFNVIGRQHVMTLMLNQRIAELSSMVSSGKDMSADTKPLDEQVVKNAGTDDKH